MHFVPLELLPKQDLHHPQLVLNLIPTPSPAIATSIMPLFSGAQNLIITNGQFFDQTVIHNSLDSGGISVLFKASIPEAAHDAPDRNSRSRCLPETRKQYIEDIINWAFPPAGDIPLPIFWMRGPAGVGKSAVAQSCVEKAKKLDTLGAAFFFSLLHERDDHTKLFTSLAYQLSIEFPEYRKLVDAKVSRDQGLVTKGMERQFRGLIVEPLQELESKGKGLGRRAIFIDGLDECRSRDAQCDIVEIITTSVREHSTPFCWAFFSRPELHLEAIFSRADIHPHCHKTILPVSCKIDGEVELYLRTSFQNVLQRHNLSLPSPRWPPDEDMQVLVGAVAGLFIYAVTLLRFFDQMCSSLGPDEALLAIQAAALNHPSGNNIQKRPLSALDGFYALILNRIPQHMLPSVQLLFAIMITFKSSEKHWSPVILANLLRFSEAKFRVVCYELRSILLFRERRDSYTPTLGESIENALPFHQITTGKQLDPLFGIGGVVCFYHKSFFDFLTDPSRSGSFCVKAPALRNDLFKHCLDLANVYDQSYSAEGPDLALAQGVQNSAVSLSWPCANEFINSFLKAAVYQHASSILFALSQSSELDPQLLQGYGDVNHRRILAISNCLLQGDNGSVPNAMVYNCPGFVQTIHGVTMSRIPADQFNAFNIVNFKKVIERLQRNKAIRPYSPSLFSIVKSLLWGRPNASVESQLYVCGNGAKMIFWYWEFSSELRFFQEFKASDLIVGEKIYRDHCHLEGWFSAN
ncbi:hypothetical protein P691DRAFT_734367 [Macrolepiota fuliginosa MF-IS2]|uniref:Nephrocystin 3-like N-terminal domain-containing protein n=1 Tax=Macrolepiota fuliginosa MF-IS2 TaxID=1400762 RepID=A0A9P5X8T4_9AGAR|nr:hypothetical protein P691DRAFT_734367 [Macrolepiota fuliginosa MF-IS2]